MPGRKSIHTTKWDKLVGRIRRKGYADNPYAVATKILGRSSFKKKRKR